MLSHLIAREIRGHLISLRFALTLGLFFVLVVSSVQIMALSYDRQLAARAESRRAQEERLKEATDFRALQWMGMEVEKRPNPLAVFAVGLEREMSRSMRVSRAAEAKLGQSKNANPLYVLFPAPDLLYIVNIVGSLVAMLFAFNAVSGELESGTLRLVMAYPVPRYRVLLAKWVGGYLALVIPFIGTLMVAVLLGQVTTTLDFSGEEWGAFLGMVGIAVLYMSLFYGIALFISTITHRSSTSLVLSFLVWVLLVLLIPNIAPIVARALAPVPSPGVLAGQRHAMERQMWRDMRSQMRGSSGNREERQRRRDEIRENIEEETGKLTRAYMAKVDEQISLAVALARLSPSASYVYATSGLAGSGASDFAGLRDYVQRYREEFMSAVNDIRRERDRQMESVTDAEERQEISEAPVNPHDLPEFAPARAGMGQILTSSQTDLAILVVLNILCFLGSNAAFLRYDLMR